MQVSLHVTNRRTLNRKRRAAEEADVQTSVFFKEGTWKENEQVDQFSSYNVTQCSVDQYEFRSTRWQPFNWPVD